MEFNGEIHDYLSGKSFSSGCLASISFREKSIPLRMDFIESIIAGKKIIHLGCTDHLALIERKIKENRWFHKRLCDAAEKCLGIDINGKAIEYCRNELGYTNILCHDIINDRPHPDITGSRWDYMIIGEILEHVDNPVLFLHAIRTNYQNCIERVIISVPNAFRYENFKLAFKHAECINSDHRYWFTPYTIAKVVDRAGMKVEAFWFVSAYEIARRYLIANALLRRYPAFRDTIVMIAAVK